jgi:hypothetical protein
MDTEVTRKERLRLTLRLGGGERSPDELTALLGVRPHSQGTKGAEGPMAGIPIPEGYWVVDTDGLASVSVDDHVAALESTLGNPVLKLDLARQHGWHPMLWLSWLSKDLGGDLLISPAAMRKLADWGVTLDVRRSSRSTDRDLSEGLNLDG